MVDDDDLSRSELKRRAVLAAGEQLFLDRGYLGTSMEDIARVARVAKQTLYRYFANKDELFIEIVTTMVNEVSDPVAEEVLALRESDRIEDDLQELATTLLRSVVQPRLQALRRLVIAESGRFPQLGRTFYDRGPGRTITALSTVFERLQTRGALSIDDPLVAASQFNWLVMSEPINRAMLLGELESPADLRASAQQGVNTFLAAYGAR